MPNFCYTRVVVTGSAYDLRNFRRRAFVRDDRTGEEFSFGQIIPMPKVLEVDVPSFDDAICVLALGSDPRELMNSGMTLEDALSSERAVASGVTSRDDLLAHLEETEPAALASVRERLAAFDEIGYFDWYSWRIDHWGTKWPACETEILADRSDRLEFRFANPWNFPEPVFAELGELFPALRFDVTALDPDVGEGVRGYIIGAELALEPISPGDVDDIAEQLFRPYEGQSRAEPPNT